MGHPSHTSLTITAAFCLVLMGCGDVERPYEPPPEQPGEVIIHEPASLTSLRTEVTGPDGAPIRVRCDSCHGLEGIEGVALPEQAADAAGPHVGLEVRHGDIECASCHAPDEPHRLRLAAGHVLPMREAMRLCAQCHGPQHRDYRRGSHGGMSGYWDLSRGDRIRNHCVDCHDPHAPAFPQFRPLPGPRDRFPPAPPQEHLHD